MGTPGRLGWDALTFEIHGSDIPNQRFGDTSIATIELRDESLKLKFGNQNLRFGSREFETEASSAQLAKVPLKPWSLELKILLNRKINFFYWAVMASVWIFCRWEHLGAFGDTWQAWLG